MKFYDFLFRATVEINNVVKNGTLDTVRHLISMFK